MNLLRRVSVAASSFTGVVADSRGAGAEAEAGAVASAALSGVASGASGSSLNRRGAGGGVAAHLLLERDRVLHAFSGVCSAFTSIFCWSQSLVKSSFKSDAEESLATKQTSPSTKTLN